MAKTIVVGGGPAGMLAAAAAGQRGGEVLLLEKNEKLGKKLFITGKGRCNLTNGADIEEFFKNIPRNPKFLYSALYGFTNTDLMELVEGLGVPLKTERGNRVFPASDKSSDVLSALNRYVVGSGVQVRLNTRVERIVTETGAVKGVETGGIFLPADAVVLATGGKSYSRTGSTGDGYDFARQCGHTVTEIRPSLIPMVTVEEWPRSLMGLSLRNVVLSAFSGKKKAFFELGELLFTHFGISGPLVLSASSCVDLKKGVTLFLDLKPGLTAQQLDARLVRDFEKYSRKQLLNAMVDLLPGRMIPVAIEEAGIDPEKPVNQLTRQEREKLCTALKGMKMTVKEFRPIEEAIVTRGGVSVREVNPSTMESKLVRGLYFAGELLDVDAYTGGFNLQIAFSTGCLAGRSISSNFVQET